MLVLTTSRAGAHARTGLDRWSRGLAFPERGEQPDDLGVGGREISALSELGELLADRVNRGEQQVHRAAINRDHSVAGAVERTLGGVRDRHEVGEAQERGAALDRVQSAEDLAKKLGVGGRLLERHQIVVEALEELTGLGEEVLDDGGIESVAHGFAPLCCPDLK